MKRTDSQILSWVAQLFDPGARESRKHDVLERIEGAMSVGLAGREALEAAMSAVLLEPGDPLPTLTGLERIAIERQRQIEEEHHSIEDDRAWAEGELAAAASIYAQHNPMFWGPDELHMSPAGWPWDPSWYKPGPTRIRDLEKAGALIAAEIDRLLAEPVVVGFDEGTASGDQQSYAEIQGNKIISFGNADRADAKDIFRERFCAGPPLTAREMNNLDQDDDDRDVIAAGNARSQRILEDARRDSIPTHELCKQCGKPFHKYRECFT